MQSAIGRQDKPCPADHRTDDTQRDTVQRPSLVLVGRQRRLHPAAIRDFRERCSVVNMTPVSSVPKRSERSTVRRFLQGAVGIHVLHHAAEREVHGAWMSEELASHGHRISPGTLYPLLHRMEAEGLLASREERTGSQIRRLYRATDEGNRALEEARAALRELADEVLD